MASKLRLGLTLTCVMIFICLAKSSSVPLSLAMNPSVHEILSDFGLPSGLLPDIVANYSLYSDLRIIVNLNYPCYVKLDNLVYYEKTITGRLDYASIEGLKGIKVKGLFGLLDVDEIRVDYPPTDKIYFQVGNAIKKLGIDQFKTVHSRCNDVHGLTTTPSNGYCLSSNSDHRWCQDANYRVEVSTGRNDVV